MEDKKQEIIQKYDLFWNQFGLNDQFFFKDLKILEIGSGTGELCLYMSFKGASQVIGIDILLQSIETAQETLLSQFPELEGTVSFNQIDIRQLSESEFDLIVSIDSFEHIIDVPQILKEIKPRLKEGGKIYISFGPLFHSPFGDHTWIRAALPGGSLCPWTHVLLPKNWLLKILSKHYNKEVKDFLNWHFLSLNQLTVADFRKIFYDSGFQVLMFQTNVYNSWKVKLFDLISKIPFLEKYFTLNILCILQKDTKTVVR